MLSQHLCSKWGKSSISQVAHVYAIGMPAYVVDIWQSCDHHVTGYIQENLTSEAASLGQQHCSNTTPATRREHLQKRYRVPEY